MGREKDSQLVSLDRLGSGAYGVVRQLQGGKEFVGRLVAMGLSIGSELEVLQNRRHGPVLVLTRGTRIALGRGEAHKILVEELR